MSKITQKNKTWLVQSQFGTYTFNNRKTAEQLNKHLNNYEKITQKINQLQPKSPTIKKDIAELKKEVKK